MGRTLWATSWVGVLVAACAEPSVTPAEGPAPDAASCAAAPAPVLHRLTRRQLGYVLTDLLDVDPGVTSALPADLQDGGLDVSSAGQRLDAPWVAAATTVIASAVSSVFDGAGVLVLPFDPVGAAATDVALTHDEPLAVYTAPVTLSWSLDVPESGFYDVDVIGRMQTLFQEGDPLEDGDPEVLVRVDGALVERVVLTNEGDEGLHHVGRVLLSSGRHRVVAEVLPSATHFASLASIHMVPSAEGGPRRRSDVLDRWVTCAPRGDEACVREVLGGFARVAWRGPVEDAALDGLVALVDVSGDTDVYEGLATAFLSTLLDPRFLFLVETPALGGPRARTPHERAARWASVLWESNPDEALLDCADSGWVAPGCREDEVIEGMLADPRADRFLQDFVVGWLGLDALPLLEEQGAPLDPALRDAMVQSAVARFRRVVTQGGTWNALLADPTTWIEGPLAAHYGLPAGTTGWHVVDGRASGWITDAAPLAAHSQPGRTSPTRRGRFLWERLHCSEVGERPAVVPSVEEALPGAGIEAVLASISEDPTCASCHGRLDPLGLSLEGFDAAGAVRAVAPLTRVWALEDGTALGTPSAVSSWLTAEDAFAACAGAFVGQWLTFAAPDPDTSCQLGALGGTADAGAWLRSALRSDAFALRGEDAP